MPNETSTAAITCPECGGTRLISVRQKRRIMNGNRNLVCSLCRTLPDPAPVTPAGRKYWTDRYPMSWIEETGRFIWGDDL
jgi:DNA-directed RNA polymerase subunit RPC12/RpoP